LRAAGCDFLRFDSESISERVTIEYSSCEPVLKFGHRLVAPSDVSDVWLRRPKALHVTNEADEAETRHTSAEWSEALEGFLAHIPIERWMNHPAHNVMASHKIEQLTRAHAHGLAVPKTLVTQSPERLLEFWEHCDGEVVLKPIASGFIERAEPADDTHIYTNAVKAHDLCAAAVLQRCPTLFQQRIQKTADVRVCIVDDALHSITLAAAEADGRQRLDIRRDNMNDVRYAQIDPPETVRVALLKLTRSYGLRFAAIDLAITPSGEWVFFEVNPNGQWAWLDLVGASDIASSFISAFQRL
jgi:glutathione synthase/RimK-type ligase-like ATP-grasp enzyme